MEKNLSDAPHTNPNSCRHIICKTKRLPANLALSYLFGVTIDQRRIRVRLPKLLANNATKRQAWAVEHGVKIKKKKKKKKKKMMNKNKNKKKDCIRPGKLLLVKKVRSIVSGVFRHKKSATGETCNPKENSKKISGKISDSVSGEDTKTSTLCDVKTDKKLSKKGESLRKIRRVQSRILIMGRRLKTIRSTRKKEREHTRATDQEDEACEELCKKRILMGGKCKPINVSGTLQYDRNGVLLPEVLL